jgi:NifU-like protein involved in Fe-S cluster formation
MIEHSGLIEISLIFNLQKPPSRCACKSLALYAAKEL